MSLPSTLALSSGYFFSAATAALTKKLMKPILHAVLLFEALLEALAHLHHRRHVDLVEGGQDGVGGLRLQQPLGHARAQPRHRHALLGAVAQVGHGRRGHRRQRLRRGRRGGAAPARRRRLRRGQRAEHVALGDAAILAGAGHRSRRHLVLGQQLGRRRHGDIALRLSAPRAALAAGAAGAALAGCGCTAPWLRCRCARSPARPPPWRHRPPPCSASTPLAGAGTSSTTLSVSISIRISSISTASPGFFFHCSKVASATDSDSCGTLTSTIAMIDLGMVGVSCAS